MAYAERSQVYFAYNLDDETWIKIGQTTNVCRRSGQLIKEGYYICSHCDIPNSRESSRVFAESFLRERINATGLAQQIRQDYFVCKDKASARWLQSQFTEWTKEIVKMIDLMERGGTVFFNFGPAKRPIPPAGRERLFAEIDHQIEVRGYYENHTQFKRGVKEEVLSMLETSYTKQMGYTISSWDNYTWTYIKIEKRG